jgi:PAS domain S-box-containing protein
VLARIPPDRLADILDIAEDGIVTVDARQQIVLFNRGAAKLFGYTPEEVVGRPLDLLIPPRFHESHRRDVDAFGRSGEAARLMGDRREVYGQRKDGSEFPAEVSISKFEGDGELVFTAIVRDVTERKRYEAARRELDQLRARAELAESQARLDAVIRSAQDAVIILDADLRVSLFNPAAERVFGCAAPAALGAELTRFLPGGLPNGPPRSAAPREVDGRRGDGTPVPLEVSVSQVEVAGQVIHTLILRDVSERKRTLAELRATTQQLWQAARLAGVGELAASIAHELNNPLGTVSLRVEGLLTRTPPDDPRRRPLEVVEQEVERMGKLVGNLLQFSRAGRDQVSTVDVREEVTRTVELIDHHLRKRQIRVEPDFAPGVPVIYADRQQLRQVFLNLFTNAADAMPAGGRLTPRVQLGELPAARPAVVVEVIDTGAGIPAEVLSRVCDPFFTTKEEGKGTGLGLAICKRIVEQHDGVLQIESVVGAGTTVRITLPVRTDKNVAGLDPD